MAKAKVKNRVSDNAIEEFRGQLLNWYDQHRRILPWRATKGQKTNPYYVWLSEIMLQQTTVGAVGPYFEKFIDRWPDVYRLAAATQEDVMSAWAGLGYYARARNLHACAKIVADDLNGIFPSDQKSLKALPGIGDYTSAAIMAIAFNQSAVVVDGNIERVMTRIFAVEELFPKSKPLLKEKAALFFDGFNERPGDLAQAFMDLGATICIAGAPRCSLCPVAEHCIGKARNIAAELPKKAPKKRKPQKLGHVYWIQNGKGQVLLHRRPQKGLLAGMLALPTSEWNEGRKVEPLNKIEGIKSFKKPVVSIHHSFTHFDLELQLKMAHTSSVPEGCLWVAHENINPDDFPTVFKKALNLFLELK